MSLTDYDGLKTALSTHTGRSSFPTGLKDDLIDQAEALFNRKLRVIEMEASTTLSVASNPVALPADFLEIVNIELQSTPKDLRYGSRQLISNLYAATTTGRPKLYTLKPGDGTLKNPPRISFYPAPDSTYTADLDYRQRIPALSDSNTANWLLLKSPDAYLHACLYYYYVFAKNTEEATKEKLLLDELLADLDAEDRSKRTSESGNRMRTLVKGP